MKRRSLIVELLEDRCVPATFGNAWPDALHLTLSFAPDGSLIGSNSSNLFATLDAQAARVVWEREVLRAFQAWAVNANINIGLVLGLAQFATTFGVTSAYVRYADRTLDPRSAKIREEMEAEGLL